MLLTLSSRNNDIVFRICLLICKISVIPARNDVSSEFLVQLGDPLPLDGTYAVLSQFLQTVKETKDNGLEMPQIEVNTWLTHVYTC